jgi:hypothetical protein
LLAVHVRQPDDTIVGLVREQQVVARHAVGVTGQRKWQVRAGQRKVAAAESRTALAEQRVADQRVAHVGICLRLRHH